jgi:hypothetical protein
MDTRTERNEHMMDPISEMRLRQAEEEARQIRERAQANVKARAAYKENLAAEKAADAQAREAEIEASLADVKVKARARWLVDHPDKLAADFEGRIWANLRRVLLIERAEAARASEEDRLRRRYGV